MPLAVPVLIDERIIGRPVVRPRERVRPLAVAAEPGVATAVVRAGLQISSKAFRVEHLPGLRQAYPHRHVLADLLCSVVVQWLEEAPHYRVTIRHVHELRISGCSQLSRCHGEVHHAGVPVLVLRELGVATACDFRVVVVVDVRGHVVVVELRPPVLIVHRGRQVCHPQHPVALPRLVD
jgi:hypothetical protein